MSLFIDSARLTGKGSPASSGLVERVAEALEGAIGDEGSRPAKLSPPNVFDSSEVPGISLRKYLRRLQTCFRCGEPAFVSALVILDRFLAGRSEADKEPRRLTALNAHRLFLTCLVVAVKYSEDLTYGNSHYAKAGGIRLSEVNRLERCLLIALDYNLRVKPDQYQLYEQALRHAPEAVAWQHPEECAGMEEPRVDRCPKETMMCMFSEGYQVADAPSPAAQAWPVGVGFYQGMLWWNPADRPVHGGWSCPGAVDVDQMSVGLQAARA
jgi:hypothetical protein